MKITLGRAVELVAMLAIAIVVAQGGRAALIGLQRYKIPAILVFVVILAILIWTLRQTPRDHPDARVRISKSVMYLATTGLALWAVVAPARWVYGGCVAAAELSLVFDMLTVLTRIDPVA